MSRERPAKKRSAAAASRDASILKAALQEFTHHGFAATRMEDIARRAGVAKGTIYLRFKDKEALFEAIVRKEISPLVMAAGAPLQPGEPVRTFLERSLTPLVESSGRARRVAIIRLVIAEAPRFPKLGELYFRDVVEPGLQAFRRLARQAYDNGELADTAAIKYPQLLLAPAIVGLLWSALFDRFEPLDIPAMMHAHFDHFFPAKTMTSQPDRR
ncbi:MAG: helix-turn-helix transcriptional regulator [Acidobacteriaceae bacterium]|nr:helix-turn-helix transcriptional regulator [Acidobacteriaceae bacterium]